MSDTSPIRFNPSKNGYDRDDSKTKPTGSAGGKNFGKILSKGEKDAEGNDAKKDIEDEVEEGHSEEASVEDAARKPASLFEMSMIQKTKFRQAPSVAQNPKKTDTSKVDTEYDSLSAAEIQEQGEAVDAIDERTHRQALTTDAAQAQAKEKQLARPFDLLGTGAIQEELAEATTNEKEKISTKFNREQPDLSSVNPIAAIPSNELGGVQTSFKADAPVLPVRSVQDLIDQMVKEVQSMEAQGKTETTVTLRHPPLFEGARLIVSSFESARGEFNIAFENLTQTAQQIISMQQNRDSLLQALEQKGYHVHIVTASTIDEQRLFTANVDDPKKDREREDEGGHSEDEREREQ